MEIRNDVRVKRLRELAVEHPELDGFADEMQRMIADRVYASSVIRQMQTELEELQTRLERVTQRAVYWQSLVTSPVDPLDEIVLALKDEATRGK